MNSQFRSNGKLLLSAEYLVLKGALALALPLNKGQRLMVEKSDLPGLRWSSFTPLGQWLEITFDKNLNVLATTSESHAHRLRQILKYATELNPEVNSHIINKRITTYLEFNPSWGWGSSSTLLHLLSQWLQVDPWLLMDKTFGGSGYDIACAEASHPIFYKRLAGQSPEISSAPFQPSFLAKLGVVWLNQKQTSSEQVSTFLNSNFNDARLIDEISAITNEMAKTNSLANFEHLMQHHEQIIAHSIRRVPVQEKLFPDFKGSIKSLGAWGGDFILFASNEPLKNTKNYFQTKGYRQMFNLQEILLQ